MQVNFPWKRKVELQRGEGLEKGLQLESEKFAGQSLDDPMLAIPKVMLAPALPG